MLVSHHYKISTYHEELATPEYEFKTLVHEFGHLFYVPDHYYGNVEEQASVENELIKYYRDYYVFDNMLVIDPNCMYGSNNGANRETMCISCHSVIESYRSHNMHEYTER